MKGMTAVILEVFGKHGSHQLLVVNNEYAGLHHLIRDSRLDLFILYKTRQRQVHRTGRPLV